MNEVAVMEEWQVQSSSLSPQARLNSQAEETAATVNHYIVTVKINSFLLCDELIGWWNLTI